MRKTRNKRRKTTLRRRSRVGGGEVVRQIQALKRDRSKSIKDKSITEPVLSADDRQRYFGSYKIQNKEQFAALPPEKRRELSEVIVNNLSKLEIDGSKPPKK